MSRTGGDRFEVEVGPARRPTWSRDAKRLLLTTTKGTGKDEDGTPVPGGFAIVDVATKAVTPVDTDAETRQGRGSYAWLPDGAGVALSYRSGDDYGMRISDLTGRETRAMNWVGYTGGIRMFSPRGSSSSPTVPAAARCASGTPPRACAAPVSRSSSRAASSGAGTTRTTC
ncbi:hypothetical protein ACFQ0B_67040 [Nonomuraea thailandensis]